MKYDVGYNLTEEIRVLLDADHKKDLESFEKAKTHILLLIDKEAIDLTEFTQDKQKLLVAYFKNLEDRLTNEKTEYLVQLLSNDLIAFNEAYNVLTIKYMEDVTKLLMEHVNGK
jgi:hypothetical protein